MIKCILMIDYYKTSQHNINHTKGVRRRPNAIYLSTRYIYTVLVIVGQCLGDVYCASIIHD